MKTLLLSNLVLLMLAGCSPADGGSTTVVYSPPVSAQLEECDQTVYLTNQSSQPLTLTAGLADDDGSNGCVDQDQATDGMVVAPGESRAVGVSLQCETCALRSLLHNVNSTDPTSPTVLHYDETLGGENIFCNDSGCIGH